MSTLGQSEKYRKPCKAAIAQALRFHFGLRVTVIADMIQWSPADVSRVTVLESWTKGIPWEVRKHQDVAIDHATAILEEQL